MTRHLPRRWAIRKGEALLLRKIVRTAHMCPAIQMSLGYSEALASNWKNAYLALKRYLSKPGRESANRPGSGLSPPSCSPCSDSTGSRIRRWRHILPKRKTPLVPEACPGSFGQNPRQHAKRRRRNTRRSCSPVRGMLGPKAEGENNPVLAQQHYALAFESFLPNWLEYQFAKERLRRLRTGK